ncbi:hypothetical protein [Tanticharoenia sakaeratensis]|uniref:Uncharacterized protein n=1 Tax=Tanticharoenia sakaeratensis NBRC 103193 TaxID=1231623 RepID=A0A0D6MQB3_9PROT|nr:hypothetical protein [Tanticharoenia sakaeratensis]GAN55468.1 hypothetical protein Tasa_048_093 [Tanticharoenia sakaeratensis NBRC 103193]GBQ21992.1 hypothetical protein AA103193_1918 [Tanticharoenia sakaeratensis NBRC 103193]
MSHTTALEQQAQHFGLRDMDLLKLAKPGLSPKDALTDLVTRYPGAFARPLNGMSREQYAAARKQFLDGAYSNGLKRVEAAHMEKLEAKYRSIHR